MANGCDHTALSPEGTAGISSFALHDGRRYWYASCCRCGHVLGKGIVDGEKEIRRMVETGDLGGDPR